MSEMNKENMALSDDDLGEVSGGRVATATVYKKRKGTGGPTASSAVYDGKPVATSNLVEQSTREGGILTSGNEQII